MRKWPVGFVNHQAREWLGHPYEPTGDALADAAWRSRRVDLDMCIRTHLHVILPDEVKARERKSSLVRVFATASKR
jgi:hypothetical protein